MIEELTDAIESIIEVKERTRYKIELGFFDGYATVEADSTGKRFCNVKLQHKDDNHNDIDLLNVPIGFPGSSLLPNDFKLTKGVDEMIVFFTDHSLQQWKDSNVPQKLKNKVKDSINHPFAVPFISHRSVSVDLNLLKIIDRLLGVLLGDKGNLDAAGSSSTGTISLPQPILELQTIRTAIQGALNV